jgi:hypothetical protein
MLGQKFSKLYLPYMIFPTPHNNVYRAKVAQKRHNCDEVCVKSPLWVVLRDIDVDVTNEVFQGDAVNPQVPARIPRPIVPHEGFNEELDANGRLQNNCAKKFGLRWVTPRSLNKRHICDVIPGIKPSQNLSNNVQWNMDRWFLSIVSLAYPFITGNACEPSIWC